MRIGFNNPIGDIVEEVREQDIDGQSGGLTPTPWIIATIATVSAVGSVATSLVSSSATNPGRYCTVSAECSTGYKPCA